MNKLLFYKIISIILLLSFIMSLFTGFSLLKQIKKEQNTAKIKIEEIQKELENKETDWFSDIDYTSLTKSELLAKKENFLTIKNSLSHFPQFEEITEQAEIEVEKIGDCLTQNSYLYPYSEEDKILLAYMIYIEAGANMISDEEQKLVGCVILNRKNQGGINKQLKNPSIKDIINEPGQYYICKYSKTKGRNTFYVDLNSINTSKISQRAMDNAVAVLEHKYTCPTDVVYQAGFPQGKTYKSFPHGAPFYNTTYFCHG